ncbi:hypothetical protein WN48_03887 [Eufriesea mexicana]|nr:hypothetical protein WN48_03887 [Eufriesea mexicana]
MDVNLKIGILVLCAGIALSLAVSSTKELLDCRANLTAAIRNDTTFMRKVRQSDYIFTGKIKDSRNGQLHVRVKRAIKGVLNATLDLALNDTCGHYIRRSYTGIFMARRDSGIGDLRRVDKIVMHFGPVPLTLANLDRLNAAVREWVFIDNLRLAWLRFEFIDGEGNAGFECRATEDEAVSETIREINVGIIR